MSSFLPLLCSILLAASLGCRDQKAPMSETPSHESSKETSTIRKDEVVTEDLVVFQDSVTFAYKPPTPEYPAELKKAGIQGEIRLLLLLNQDGQIIKVQKESGRGEFLQSAEAYAQSCRFKVAPAPIRGKDLVPFRLTLQYRLPLKPQSPSNAK